MCGRHFLEEVSVVNTLNKICPIFNIMRYKHIKHSY